ncbi:unnamed protein product, partial [Didymodactylos carnosus]
SLKSQHVAKTIKALKKVEKVEKDQERHTESSSILIQGLDTIIDLYRFTGVSHHIVEKGLVSIIGATTGERFSSILELFIKRRAGRGLVNRFLYFSLPMTSLISPRDVHPERINQKLPSIALVLLIIARMEDVEFRFSRKKRNKNSEKDNQSKTTTSALLDDSENRYDDDDTVITYTNYTASLVHFANVNDSLPHEDEQGRVNFQHALNKYEIDIIHYVTHHDKSALPSNYEISENQQKFFDGKPHYYPENDRYLRKGMTDESSAKEVYQHDEEQQCSQNRDGNNEEEKNYTDAPDLMDESRSTRGKEECKHQYYSRGTSDLTISSVNLSYVKT